MTETSVRGNGTTVYDERGYAVASVAEAKRIAGEYLCDLDLGFAYGFGLPEVDDRYHIWRVPVISGESAVGEIAIDGRTSLVQESRSTEPEMLRSRHLSDAGKPMSTKNSGSGVIVRSELRNTVLRGDSESTLAELPAGSVDLVFTSPPYFNARPDYSEYAEYEDYLAKMGRVIGQCSRLLADGRFFVINISPVLLRRASRSQASRRIAVPFDLHSVIVKQGFDFIDDIIWEKPEGAGWATGRGRRFAADRNPLQYKAVPVTEYVLVYRKHTDRLIDWNIRKHHDQDAVARSKVSDDYEKTNIWRISPSSTKDHPAVFPVELAERVVQYYSFSGDVVLDPFAGIGTVAKACIDNDRRFVMAEVSDEYIGTMKRNLAKWGGSGDVHCINTDPINDGALF
ncbi:MAG: site-specific DNA-methyltransferase [Acidimicrobiia bacterium]|nr:site-specific DNA-methyltransferase [Acidimicrobiia bacterium]MCY4458470.1 site-specific DNA-methyltransferase [Acidimicrobiaceae bacterium]